MRAGRRVGRAHRECDQAPPRTDSDGNLTKDGSFKYFWNAENRLIRVRPKGAPSSGDVRLTYVYDYLGRRVRKTVETHNGSSWSETADTKFVWYNWLMLLELDDNDDVLRKYSWGLDLAGQAGQINSLEGAGGIGGLVGVRNLGESPARSYVYFCDGNGNIGQAINRSSDTIDAKYEYDAYGNNLLDASDPNESGPFADDNPFRFSTKYYDGEHEDAATVVNEGTYSYIFRDYWPRLGRWGSEDPIGEPGGANLIAFVSNDPIRQFDPQGLDSFDNLAIGQARLRAAFWHYMFGFGEPWYRDSWAGDIMGLSGYKALVAGLKSTIEKTACEKYSSAKCGKRYSESFGCNSPPARPLRIASA